MATLGLLAHFSCANCFGVEELIPTVESVLSKYASVNESRTVPPEASVAELPMPNNEPLVPIIPLSAVKIQLKSFQMQEIGRFEVFTVAPNTKDVKPLVFVLDPEIWIYYHMGINRFRKGWADPIDGEVSDQASLLDFNNMPVEPVQSGDGAISHDEQQVEASAEANQESIRQVERIAEQRPQKKVYQAYYSWKSPLGSQLLKRGYQVVFPHPRSLAKLRGLTFEDWVYLFNELGENNSIDKESLFLMATREYADIASKIAMSTKLNAIVLEEPELPINGSKIYSVWTTSNGKSPWDVLHENSKFEYLQITSLIEEKLMIVREKDSSFFEFNNETLISSLLASRKHFVVALLEKNPRKEKRVLQLERIRPPLTSKEIKSFQYEYDPVSMHKWINRALAFLYENAETKPLMLKTPIERPHTVRAREWRGSAPLESQREIPEGNYK